MIDFYKYRHNIFWEWGMGHGAWGMGMGHGAWGMGLGARGARD
ncbi:hypothetical protein [Microcoleus sp. FACHB-68]|nr:hypothetical protein [Microcoleus sp. FACHB-68]